MMTRRHRRALAIARVALGVTFAAICLMLYWLLWPSDDITFTPWQTERDTYAAGEVVTMSDTFCWDGRPFEAARWFVIERTRVEGGVVQFTGGYGNPTVEAKYADDGCAETTVRVALPVTLRPGEYQIAYDVTYRPDWNPIARTITNTSNPFTVTKPA